MEKAYKVIISVLAVVLSFQVLAGGKGGDIGKSGVQNAEEKTVSQEQEILDEEDAKPYIPYLVELDEKESGETSDAEETYEFRNANRYKGRQYYRFQKTYQKKPIYGASVTVVSDEKGDVTDVIRGSQAPLVEEEAANMEETQTKQAAESYLQSEYKVTKDSIDCSEGEEMLFEERGRGIPAYLYNIAGQTKDHKLIGKEVLVSAIDGAVLAERPTIYYASETGTYPGQKKNQKIVYNSDEKNCTMNNTEDEIVVYQPLDRSDYYWYREENHREEAWTKGENPDPSAVDAMANMMKVVDFYSDGNYVDFKSLTGSGKVNLSGNAIETYVNVVNLEVDGESLSFWNNAFFWKTPSGTSLIAFTLRSNENTAQFSADLDVVAHEFGHSIFDRVVFPSGGESGSLNEGYADIMGLLAESHALNREIDWEVTGIRNMKESKVTHYDQLDQAGEDTHVRGQLITYAAYLMSKGYETEEFDRSMSAISSMEQVTDLWLSSLYLLPGDANFIDWREAMERAAEQLYEDGDLTKAQKECVTLAMDEVGIPKIVTDQEEENASETENTEEPQETQEAFRAYVEEELIPKYGIMPTEEKSFTQEGSDSVWLSEKDLRGILAFEIYDYDQDGAEEMLLVRGTCEDTDPMGASGTDDRGRGVRIHLEMYEHGEKTELADSRELIPCGNYRVTHHMVQTGIFTYSDSGNIYIGVDNFFRMNENITTLALYQYENQEFQYAKGACRQRQGGGLEAVLATDKEPDREMITFAPTYTGNNRCWNVLEEEDASQLTNEEWEETALKLNDLYYRQLEPEGLNSTDVRLLPKKEKWDARTKDVYTSESGDLSVVASIAACFNYPEHYLFREDPAGSMDPWR